MDIVVREINALIDLLLRLLSKDEWIALISAWWLGVALTEVLKRAIRGFIIGSTLPNTLAFVRFQSLFPLLGVGVTGTATYLLWPDPQGAVLDNATLAALLNGVSAPTIYRVFMALLRKRGCEWLAAALTGDRRRENKGPPENVPERRSGE